MAGANGSSKPRSLCGEMSELAEGARLEIVCAAKSGTEGSNPSLSAIGKVIQDALCCFRFLQENAYVQIGKGHVLLGFGEEIPPPNL